MQRNFATPYNPTDSQVAAEWTGAASQAAKPELQRQAVKAHYQGAGQVAPRSFGKKAPRSFGKKAPR